MARTTGTMGTNGFGFLVTGIGADGFMGIMSEVAGGIGDTPGRVIGTIVIMTAATTVVTMIAMTTAVGIVGAIATMTGAGVATKAARLPSVGDLDPLEG